MSICRLLSAICVLAPTTVPAAAAEECLAGFDERVALLEHASNCEKSLALFQGCSYAASGDVGLSQVVIKKCEGDFVKKLSKAQRQTYYRQQQRCARKYQDQSGTMYRSFEAFCSAILAKDYSRRFANGSKS
jgi:hypothetical protein